MTLTYIWVGRSLVAAVALECAVVGLANKDLGCAHLLKLLRTDGGTRQARLRDGRGRGRS
jgi:hypothetical protein